MGGGYKKIMPLLSRLWSPTPTSSLPSGASSTFSIATWNCLADGLTRDFTHAPPDLLAWPSRAPQILDELTSLDADVLCLQEINRVESLAPLNLTHALLFAPKLRSPALEFGAPGCGTALLVRRARFDVVDVETVYFKADASTLSNQNAIVTILRDKLSADGRLIVVASTHLKAGEGEEYSSLRVFQVEQLVAHARGARMRAEGAEGTAPVPIFIAGDFNTRPGEAPYASLLTTLPGTASAFNVLHRPERGVEGVGGYADGEPAWTTFKFRGHEGAAGGKEKRACIDYIFFSAGAALVGVRALPTAEQAGALGLPNASFPSDHVPLAALFAWQ